MKTKRTRERGELQTVDGAADVPRASGSQLLQRLLIRNGDLTGALRNEIQLLSRCVLVLFPS